MAARRMKAIPAVEPPPELDSDDIEVVDAAFVAGTAAPEPPPEEDAATAGTEAPPEDAPQVVVFDSGREARQRYRALQTLRYASKGGVWCVIQAGRTFETDELAFDPHLMERVDG